MKETHCNLYLFSMCTFYILLLFLVIDMQEEIIYIFSMKFGIPITSTLWQHRQQHINIFPYIYTYTGSL